MKATYIQDHPIRPLEEWTGKQSRDWLHPCHGPLPTKIGSVLCNEDEYLVCLWLLENRITTVTELVDTVDVNEDWGNRSNKKGWIMNSLNWYPDGHHVFTCGSCCVKVPSVLKQRADQAAEEKLFQQIMTKSVEITVCTPLGDPTLYLYHRMEGRP